MVREVRITLSESEHNRLIQQKKGRTWKEVLQDGAEVDPKELEEFNEGA